MHARFTIKIYIKLVLETAYIHETFWLIILPYSFKTIPCMYMEFNDKCDSLYSRKIRVKNQALQKDKSLFNGSLLLLSESG